MHHQRYIVHVDMDAFFAAVEQRDRPALRGKPVVVGSDPKEGHGRGVVSTASYEARAFGIHSAMPIAQAYRACPQAVFLPVDGEKYSAVSHQFYDILYSFTPDLEPVSIDEAFLDITGSFRIFGTPLETCRKIQERIATELSLTASVGLAPTKMAAKIASDLKKPCGLVVVDAGHVCDFLWPLPVRKLWGLGAMAEKALRAMGIMTIGELAARPRGELAAAFGKCGEDYWDLAHGIDDRAVEPSREPKSVSNETTFDEDTADDDKILATLSALSEKVSYRLREDGYKARTITLKIRLEGFHTYTRSVTCPVATTFVEAIYGEIHRLYREFRAVERSQSPGRQKKVRLVGVRVSQLSPMGAADDLFAPNTDDKRERVHRAVDVIRKKFGGAAIHRGASQEGA